MKNAAALLCGALAALALALPLRAESAPQSPAEEVKKTIDEVVKIVEEHPSPEQATTRRQKMREVINPRFDFEEMAKRSLGAEWKERSPQEQQEFTDVFSKLLAKTYLSRIDTVRRGMVTIAGETVDSPRAIVKTMVENKGNTFPIDYKLIDQSGTWRVYDVVIENIGLVANYRNEFAGIIRREKFDGLMKILKQKAEKQDKA